MDRTVHGMLGIVTAVLVCASLYFAYPIVAPVAFALFVIAIVWPVQRTLGSVMPKLLALAVTVIVTACVIAVLGGLAAWGFGRVSRWLIENAGRLQALYLENAALLEARGLYVAGTLAKQFDLPWLLGFARQFAGTLQNGISFALLTFVFIILGLLEVEGTARKLEGLGSDGAGAKARFTAMLIASKLQKYVRVRSVMSIMTGLVVWGFAWFAGIELALEWGVITFVLNYIPFIGPLVASVLPAIFAAAQFESLQAAIAVFAALNLIQFVSGSYMEPRIAGAALSLSPFFVLFSVFFWSFLWGVPGAFIGVPIMIASVTICDQHPTTRWIATLLAGSSEGRARANAGVRAV